MTKFKAAKRGSGYGVYNTAASQWVSERTWNRTEAREIAKDMNAEAQAQQELDDWYDGEEAREMMWLASGGPQKATAKHKAAADESIRELEQAGWRVMDKCQIREPFEDVAVTEVVARRDDTVYILRWMPFNNFWMRGHESGGRSSISRKELGLPD